jgi:hypothetical protein
MHNVVTIFMVNKAGRFSLTHSSCNWGKFGGVGYSEEEHFWDRRWYQTLLHFCPSLPLKVWGCQIVPVTRLMIHRH